MTNSVDLCEHGEESKDTTRRRRRRRRRLPGRSSITQSSLERRKDRLGLSAGQLVSARGRRRGRN